MSKKTLWKDIKKCFLKSKGRFFSIMSLIALGSFALVGLQVTGPDMRQTGADYFDKLHTADITVIGDYGIDAGNREAIGQVSGAETIEYGYLKDVTVKKSLTSIRIFSATDTLSQYEVVTGRMPEAENEIAIASFLSEDYQLGDTISFTEKEDSSGNQVLTRHKFKIVGFVNSAELLSSINLGNSTAGSGKLSGYAVVTPGVFDSEVYMIARLSFSDTAGVDPYSDTYTDRIQAHKEELAELLADQPALRLQAIRDEYQAQIDDGQSQVNDARQQLEDAKGQLADGRSELDDGYEELNTAKNTLSSAVAIAQAQIEDGAAQLTDGWQQIASGETQLAEASASLQSGRSSLAAAREQYSEKQAALNAAAVQIKESEQALDAGQAQLDAKQAEYDSGYTTYTAALQELTAAQTQIDTAQAELAQKKSSLEAQKAALEEALPDSQTELQTFLESVYTPGLAQISQAQTELDEKKAEAAAKEQTLAASKGKLDTAKEQLDAGNAQLAAARTQLETAREQLKSGQAQLLTASLTLAQKNQLLLEKEAEYQSGIRTLEESRTLLLQKESELAAAKQMLMEQTASGKQEIAEAEALLAEKEQEYQDALTQYEQQAPEAEQEIADAEAKLADARETLTALELPVYALDTRREIPGAEGYKIYGSVSDIVDSLADVFPIFLYLVAALVTLTTMTRFVDEERINCGTLKALGYSNRDILKKFAVYGWTASFAGAVTGIIAGHTLIPLIVYNAYGHSFTYPKIELHFYPGITLTALLLAFASAVVPAYLVAIRELREKPATLLLPKPPAAGSKILLERIRPLWNRLSFTHKVTARNIFRYKKRMLMTVFGVCGAVSLLFAGLSVQHSISGVNDRQFGEILKYDLIVARESNLSEEQEAELTKQLSSDEISQQLPVVYQELTKVAGDNRDKQEIKLIVPENTDEISDFIQLVSRKTGKSIRLSDDGAVISERLAKLLNVTAGDRITVTDPDNNEYELTVSAVTEMYTGHFLFLSPGGYEEVFKKSYEPNANLVTLKDSTLENADKEAGKFIALDSVEGVVQNTTLINQINTIVKSLNKIMDVLILVAVLLGIVILYNLTNINVSERIRELSTIKVLGFYDKEVTMYIYRETILLTILGIFAGFLLGDALYLYILEAVPPDEVMFNPALGLKAFLVPASIVCLITLILGFVIHRRLKHVDMLEALKSVD